MTRHLDAVSVTEHRVVLALAREFAERANRSEAAIQRVRELLDDECFSQCSCGHCPILVDARDVRRALDGGTE